MKNLTKKQESVIKGRIAEYVAAGHSVNDLVFEEISETNGIEYQQVKDYFRYVISQ